MSSAPARGRRQGTDRALARCIAMDRRLTLRGSAESHEFELGWVARNRELPVYMLNAVILAAPLPASLSADEVIALAEHHQGDAGQRCVRVEDELGAARLTPALTKAGWRRQRTVLMALDDDAAAPAHDPRARQISEAELDRVMQAHFQQYDYGSDYFDGLPEILVQANRAERDGTAATAFGAADADGTLASMCTLFCDEDVDGTRVAMVEQVATLPDYRERGLAQAVVNAAVAAARAGGYELIMLCADAEDWPQLIYAKLGFQALGETVSFRLASASGQHRRDVH